jgi:hypothetical protein
MENRIGAQQNGGTPLDGNRAFLRTRTWTSKGQLYTGRRLARRAAVLAVGALTVAAPFGAPAAAPASGLPQPADFSNSLLG